MWSNWVKLGVLRFWKCQIRGFEYSLSRKSKFGAIGFPSI